MPNTSGAPTLSQTYTQGQPIRLDVPNGQHTLVLTTFMDAAAKQPTGSSCSEQSLEPGGTVCLNLQVTPYVRGCPSNATRCMDTCCAGGTCDATTCALSCKEGFADCNHDVADGCETNLSLAGQRMCGPDCISANSCCTSEECTHPNMTPVACYGGTCPSEGGTCTYAQKTGSVICGNLCCKSIGGACKSDCTLSCTGNNVDCDNDPSDGCEADLTKDVNNCGSCGRVCAGTGQLHVVTAACVGKACAPTKCEDGWRDCNGNSTPDDGCECAAPACDVCGCPLTHDTGFKDASNKTIPYYDCSTLSNYSLALATDAANGYIKVMGGTLKPLANYTPDAGSPGDAVDAMCVQTATDCPCWTYAARGKYHPNSEGYAYKAPGNTCIPALGSTVGMYVRWN